jgi:DME family drug/metabolite transporter
MCCVSWGHAGERRGIVLVLLAAVLWGTVGVSAQVAYGLDGRLTPLLIGFYRLLVAAVAMLLTHGVRPRQQPRWRIAAGRPLLGAVLAGVLLGGYQACYFGAVRGVGVSLATLITLGLAPVLVTVGTGLAGQRPSRRALLALALALLGLLLLVGLPAAEPTATVDRRLGVLLALGSATGYAALAVLGRWLAPRLGPREVNLVSFSAGTLVLLPFALGSGSGLGEVWAVAPLVYLGLVPTVLAYGLFFSGVRTVAPGVASTLTLVEPLTATLLAALLLGERLSGGGIAGAALLLGAVALLSLGRSTPVSGGERLCYTCRRS